MQALSTAPAARAADERPRRTTGFHFVDHLGRDARTLAGIDLTR